MTPNIEASFRALADAQRDLARDWLRRFGDAGALAPGELLRAVAAASPAQAQRIAELQARHYTDMLALWNRYFGPRANPAADPAPAVLDRRFAAREWRELPWFDFLHRVHLTNARWLQDLVDLVPLDQPQARKLRFLARQFADAMAPSNHPGSNPEVIRLAFESGGESLKRGLANLGADLARGRISMTDETAFRIGRDIAATPGAVVYENALIQLIQYRATTGRVHARPLLIVPPCINKYYVLDLRPHNSLVRHAVAAGHTVFMISWRNIGPPLGTTTWDDYLERGVAAAIDVALAITGADRLDALGFCVGGTILACTLAMLQRRGREPAASLTLLATLLDFADPGEIGVYIDEAHACRTDRELGGGGVVPGAMLAATFASLRANDLVWHYVVNNYLKGQSPAAFDLLHWNADSANLAGPMYAYYIRRMYLDNALRDAGRLTMGGVPIDLGRIRIPAYVLGAAEDHIVPWRSAYASAALLGGRTQFVLTASGHIAGVVNPPTGNRRSFRAAAASGRDADAWLARAAERPGSWWPHWTAWLARRAGPKRAAPEHPGSSAYPPLEPAPGRYVSESVRTGAQAQCG